MKLVKVVVDGRPVEVPAGTLVTDAARVAEVHVPIFCSHSKLPPLGACRICVVEIGTPKMGPDKKPVLAADGSPEIAWMPKVQTGCTTTVSDGMHVRTKSDIAEKARQGVMEFLLVNHPLDCPVCDEGGECQLQDLAFAFGADFSRMDEAKRTFDSEDLGPIVKKEANRCIVCMRCVRYCDEIIGDTALTAHQRGVWTEISSFNRQPLECEQCGNCIEVCPVGALTALPYRFKARPWDLRQHVTICPWCSNGCSVRLGVRGEEVLRARGTEFRGVNQEYLCVRGRFGYEFIGDGDRLTAPLVRLGGALAPSTFEEAVAFTAARLREIAATHGPQSIAFLGGDKMNVEEQYLFQKLARSVLGTPHVDSRTRVPVPLAASAILAATGGGRAMLTLAELEHAHEVLVLGDDLQGEAPYAQAIVIKGARHRGLRMTIAHTRRIKLTRPRFNSQWLAYRPGAERALLMGLVRAALDAGGPKGGPADVAQALASPPSGWTLERAERESGVPAAALAAAAKRLLEAPRKAILFGRAVTEHPDAPALLALVQALGWATGSITEERSCVMYLSPQNNGQGALDMGLAPDLLPGSVHADDAEARAAFQTAWGGAVPSGGMTAADVLASAADGQIKALWIASDHWLRSAPDRALAERALAQAELVVVNDLFLTETGSKAHVVFPVCSFAEKEGVVVNCERRLQKTVRALSPRRGARPDWQVFQAVARALGAPWSYRTAEDVFREIGRVVPTYRGLSWASLLPNGLTWAATAATPALRWPADAAPAQADGAGLVVLSGGVLFLQGSLSHHGTLLPKLAKEPRAWLHPDEAARLAIADGDPVQLVGPSGTIGLAAGVDAGVPPGGVFVPYAFPSVELNRLGAPRGAGLRVTVRKASVMAEV